MININWEDFFYDYIWFGWYMNYDYGIFPCKTYWRYSKDHRWKMMTRKIWAVKV